MAYEPDQVTSAGAGSSSAARGTQPPPPYPEGTSSEEIRRDIERTRAEMDNTVDALQERLKPRHLLDDVLDLFRGGGKSSAGGSGSSGGSGAADMATQVGSKVLDKLKQHPMPAALIGAGIVWLMFEGDDAPRSSGPGGRTLANYTPRKWDVPEHSGSFVDGRTGQPYAANYGHETGGGTTSAGNEGPGMMERAKDALGSAADSVKDTLSGAASAVSGAASTVGDKASQLTGSARGAASGAGSAMRGYSSGASDQLDRGYQAGKHYLERGLEEYPLAVGAAAMALGVLTGLLLPNTRTEDRLMGERADEIKDQVKETGQSVVEGGKQVASATANAALGEAGNQGAGSLVDKVKNVARDVATTAAESARREGLDPSSLAHKGQQIAERAKDAATDEAQRQKDRATS